MSPNQVTVIDTRQGRFLIVNPRETIQASLLQTRVFELHVVKLGIAVARKKVGSIVDVGANIGTFSIPLAKTFPDRRVFCYEPQNNVFHHLCANLLLNRLENVEVNHKAISHDVSAQTIAVPRFDVYSERYTGSVSLDPNVINIRKGISGVAEPAAYAVAFDEVPIVTLDESLKDQEIALIKIDVEGMEQSVMKSATKIIEKYHPALIFEAWDLPQFEQHNLQVFQHVTDLGYRIVRLQNDCIAIHLADAELLAAIERSLQSAPNV